jgi:predicted P-loop ATPase
MFKKSGYFANLGHLVIAGIAPDAPRRFICVGTTNEAEFLDDPTGERRFLPMTITRLDSDAIARDRNQLWAEGAAWFRTACASYRKAANQCDWHDAEALAKAEHGQYTRHDDIEAPVARALERFPPGTAFVLVDLMAAMGIDATRAQADRSLQMRVGTILKRLGFENKDRWNPLTKRNGKMWSLR